MAGRLVRLYFLAIIVGCMFDTRFIYNALVKRVQMDAAFSNSYQP